MLFHRGPRSSRRPIIFAVTCTGIAFLHKVDGFPVLVQKAATTTTIPRVVLDSKPPPPPPHVLPSSNAIWFDSSDNTAVSVLVARSSASSDVVHDKLFVPAIASMAVLAVICVICCYQLIVSRDTVYSRGAMPNAATPGAYGEPPTLQSHHAIGRQQGQENGYGSRPSSRALSKTTRKSAPSISSSMPGSPSVASDAIGFHHHLQQQRLQQQRREFEQQQQQQQQQQDPYQQYMMAHDHGHSQQHHQSIPQPSVAGSVVHLGGGFQPQPHGVQTHATQVLGPDPVRTARAPSVTQTGQPPPFPNAAGQQSADPAVNASWDQYWAQQEHQNLQRHQYQQHQQHQQHSPHQHSPQPDPRTSHVSSAQTSSTRVTTSDVLSYMTPPEARRAQLPGNQSQPQHQNSSGYSSDVSVIPLHIQPGSATTHGNMAPPVNYTPTSVGPATHGHTQGRVNSDIQPPAYFETRGGGQGKTAVSKRRSEKTSSSKLDR